ncbi:exocyst complex component Sec8 [Colletotrichum tofieldiae]|nr:exocyst complex component Sec8 [Colletotrichum tofieldiae]
MERIDTTNRLSRLRELMKERNVDVYVIPSEDSHASEYIAGCDARREFISGFSGSAGCAVVTLDKAALATDGRYFNQASKQLDQNWQLLKQGLQDVPTWQEWSAEQSTGGKVVGVDPELITGSIAKKLAEKVKRSGGSDLVPLDQNLVDLVWAKDRPARPKNPVKVLPNKFSGKDVKTKLKELRQELDKKNSRAFVVSMLDEIAWLFNLRGDDIPYNPVFFSYAIITSDSATLYNKNEMGGMRACHIRDGAALIEYFAWLEDQLVAKKVKLDEVQAADKLEQLRSKQKDYVGLSFDTISSTGANAAVIHYKPERGACSVIDPTAIYLCDSGAQYLDGTTDTTRTLHFGQPTEAEKLAYTLVLKGNIALDTAIFPKGTTGFALDCLARQHLWKEGLDYRHGTGHGVGSYLNVHEGPIGIGTRVQFAEVALAPGNVVSIEPGFYEDGSYGIRIENVAMVTEVKTKHSFGDKPYLGFEHVTMVPYCQNLIEPSLLTAEEKAWLNAHNADIFQKTKEYFRNDPLTLTWLIRETQPL